MKNNTGVCRSLVETLPLAAPFGTEVMGAGAQVTAEPRAPAFPTLPGPCRALALACCAVRCHAMSCCAVLCCVLWTEDGASLVL